MGMSAMLVFEVTSCSAVSPPELAVLVDLSNEGYKSYAFASGRGFLASCETVSETAVVDP